MSSKHIHFQTVKVKLKNRCKVLLIFTFFLHTGCKKLVEINAPTNTITTSQTFVDSSNAASSIAGLYSVMVNTFGDPSFGNGGITIFCGASADELQFFGSSYGSTGDQFTFN